MYRIAKLKQMFRASKSAFKLKSSYKFSVCVTATICLAYSKSLSSSLCDSSLIDRTTVVSTDSVRSSAKIVETTIDPVSQDLINIVWGWIQSVIDSLNAIKRILFCTAVATPAALATPIALYLGREKEMWDYIIWCIEILGPTFIKLAQWASTRPDLFPEELTVKLQSLQDSTRTHSWSTAAKTLDEAFGPDWREFLIIDEKPIGSGCIAQVYKGIY